MDKNSYEALQQGYNPLNQYGSEDDDDDEEEEEEEEELSMDDEHLGDEDARDNNQNIRNIQGASNDVDNDEDEDDDDGFYEEADEEEDDAGVGNADIGRHPKKRKLMSLSSSYEFAPRAPPLVPIAKPLLVGGRNPLTDWTEQETFALLDAWGDKFLQRGRKSLRSDEWLEVADKVSEVSTIERTDTQCKNRLDTVKKKYKKEKGRMVAGSCTNSTWVYFRKMDMLMSQQGGGKGLSCGLDSGEYVFMNPKAYLNRANGFGEMRDSPGNSESGDDDDISDGLPPKKRWCRSRGRNEEEGSSSFHLLADSIERFSEIYEKIETSKRQQMVELEKMRMDFHRDLEIQRREIMERAQLEMAKIGGSGDDEEQDISGESASA